MRYHITLLSVALGLLWTQLGACCSSAAALDCRLPTALCSGLQRREESERRRAELKHNTRRREMEMKHDCPETFSTELKLPNTISGLNIWPPKDPNMTTQDIYCASNRGQRRANFVVNPEWTSENVSDPPRTVRTAGRVYEPTPIDFHGARDLHAKTWEQPRIHPGHGVNSHQAIPGYAPYKHEPLHYRYARQQIDDSWPWNQFQPNKDTFAESEAEEYRRPKTAAGAYYTHPHDDQRSQFARELNALHATHVQDKMSGGKPDIETREFTRSNREITYGYNRPLSAESSAGGPYTDALSKLPQPFGRGGHRELTDLFAQTYSRNLPQMLFRKAQHAHAPWHAYMTFCDWGEPVMQVPHPLAGVEAN